LRKTQVPHRIDKILDKSLYRGGNSHLTSRFCEDELGPKFQQIWHTRYFLIWTTKLYPFNKIKIVEVERNELVEHINFTPHQ